MVSILTICGCVVNPKKLNVYPSGSVYTYQPLNPTTIWIDVHGSGNKEKVDITSSEFSKALLKDLDTEVVRISLNTMNGDIAFNAGIVGASVKGQSYVLTVDYIKYLTKNLEFNVDYVNVKDDKIIENLKFNKYIPIYAGIGLRVKAEFIANESGLNISGLPAIAFAANSKSISGRLTVQTLGITGEEVTYLMPIISDISISSIQSAVQAVAAIKAKIYEDSTVVYPKIIGFESPSKNPSLIRAITEKLYASEEWICPEIIEVNNSNVTKRKIQIDWCDTAEEQDDKNIK